MTMKACPYCAEDIKAEAIKCRYCGAMLTAAAGQAEAMSGVVTDKGRTIAHRNIPRIIAGILMAIGFAILTYWGATTVKEMADRQELPRGLAGFGRIFGYVILPVMLAIAGICVAIFRDVKCPYCGKKSEVTLFSENCKCSKCQVLNVIIWE